MIDVPPGATIASIVLAMWRAGETSSFQRTVIKAFGTRLAAEDVFGLSVVRVSKNLFRGLISPEQLLEQHTIMPFMSRLLDPARAREWRSKILSEQRLKYQFFLRALASRPTSREWRTCPDCQDNDRSKYGVAHWHAAHQLRFLKSCIHHQTPLHFRCRHCHGPLGHKNDRRLPGEPCPRCTSAETEAYAPSTSPGYAGTLELCANLFALPCEDYAPLARRRLFSVHLRRVGDGGAAEFTRQLLDHWHCTTLAEIAMRLECPVSEAIIGRALLGHEYAAAPPLLFAMCEFATSLTTGTEPHETTVDMFAMGPESLLSKEDWDVLHAHATKMGFPLTAARRVAEGASYHRLQTERLASVPFAQSFVNTAPQRIRDQLPQASAGFRKKLTWPRHLARPDPLAADPTEALTAMHRARLTFLMESGVKTREALGVASQTSMNWARAHDKEWLDSFCPRRPTNWVRGAGERRSAGNPGETSERSCD